MSRKHRSLSILIVAQSVCLAFGLWLQDRFVVATAQWQQDAVTKTDSAETGSSRIATPGTSHTTSGATPTAKTLLAAMPGARLLSFGLQAVVAYLMLSRIHNRNAGQQQQSTEHSVKREKDLVRTRDAVIFGLAKLAESRDADTGHHLERISLYATRLAAAVSRIPRYRNEVTSTFVRTIGISSALHDIGKVGVEDSILLKPDKLDEDERFRMQFHAAIGGKCIQEIERRLGKSNFLQMARDIALYHHERWDGAGYPHETAGQAIPLAARIVSIADVYDALSVRRVYKEAFPHEKCVQIIREGAGTQFDPNLVEIFLDITDQFRAIAAKMANSTVDETTPTVTEEEVVRPNPPAMTSTQEQVVTTLLESEPEHAETVAAES